MIGYGKRWATNVGRRKTIGEERSMIGKRIDMKNAHIVISIMS